MCNDLVELKRRMTDRKREMRDRLDELYNKKHSERENNIRLFIIDLPGIIERYIISCLEAYGNIANKEIKNTRLSLDKIHEDVLGSAFRVHETKLSLDRREENGKKKKKKNLYVDTRDKYYKIMNGSTSCFCIDREALRKTLQPTKLANRGKILTGEYKLEIPKEYEYEGVKYSNASKILKKVDDLSLARHPLAHGGISLEDDQKTSVYLEGDLDLTNRVLAIYYTAMENGMNSKCYLL